MRPAPAQLLRLALCALLGVLADAGESRAAPLPWEGTLELELHRYLNWQAVSDPRTERDALARLAVFGSGVGTLNGSSAGPHLASFRLDGGITGFASAPVTDPDASLTIPRVEASVELGSGTLSPGGPGVLPVRGMLKVCVIYPSCGIGAFYATPMVGHGVMSNSRGFGIGGAFTTRFVETFSSPFRTSIIGAPWSLGPATLGPTSNGGALAVTGFAHGPASLTSSTASEDGIVQLVTAVRVESEWPWRVAPTQYFGILTLRFVPEPGPLLLLGSGVLGLALLGLRRRRR